MADLASPFASQIDQAHQQGYSDDDIVNHLALAKPELSPKIKEAQASGHSATDITGFLRTWNPQPIHGMEKLGGTPPAAGAMPLPDELNPNPPAPTGFKDALSDFVTSPQGLIRSGLRQAVQGVESGAEPGINPKLHAASEVIKGLGKASLPAAIPAALANPPGAAMALAGGSAAKVGANYALPKLGASPEATELGGDIAGLAGGVAGAKLSGMIPSTARAGANFQDALSKAGDIPIDETAVGEAAIRARQLASSGGVMPKVVNDFLKRISQDKPLTYAEARDFYSNASRLSADEANRLTPVMKRQVGEFTRSLGKSIEGAAEQGGAGPQYRDAMSEYRKAAKLREFGDAAKDVAKKAAITGAVGAAGYGAYKALSGGLAKGGVITRKGPKGAAGSVEDRVRGSANVPLSPEGTQQAAQLGQALAKRGFGKRGDTITPGVLDRTQQTGALIAKSAPGARMMPPDPSLDTWRLGAIEGQPTDAVHSQIEQLVKNPDQVPPPGDVSSAPPESFNAFKRRYLPPWKARYAAYLKQPNARHIFITHGRGSRLLKAWVANGMPDDLKVDPSYILNENDKPADVHRIAPGPKGKPQISEVNPEQAGRLKQGLFSVRHAQTPWNNSSKKQTGKPAAAEFKRGGVALPHGLSPVQMLHA